MLALHCLPRDAPAEPGIARRLRDAGSRRWPGGGGGGVPYGVLTRPTASIRRLSSCARRYPRGGGRNVVNVIIVDFRGFDTLGEIAVLGIAALIIHALLRRLRPAAPRPRRRVAGDRHPLLLTLLSRRCCCRWRPLVAVFLFLRGHNLPGGGFIAGLVLAVALLVLYVARGSAWIEARLRPALRVVDRGWACWLAGLTGVGRLAVRAIPFLTSTSGHPVLPAAGRGAARQRHVLRPGRVLTVVGATLLALLGDRRGSGSRCGAHDR